MSLNKNLFSFEGRLGRGQYWIILAIVLVLSLLVGLIIRSFSGSGRPGQIVGIVLYGLWLFPLIWVVLAAAVKRWHDLNLSGMMMLLWFIPAVGGVIVLAWLGFVLGTKGRNKYGRIQ